MSGLKSQLAARHPSGARRLGVWSGSLGHLARLRGPISAPGARPVVFYWLKVACGAFSERAVGLFTTRGKKAWFPVPLTGSPVPRNHTASVLLFGLGRLPANSMPVVLCGRSGGLSACEGFQGLELREG